MRNYHRTPFADANAPVKPNHMPEQIKLKPEQQYLEFLAQGKFMLQRSRSTGRFIFYPRAAEPLTGSTDLEWIEASGRGTVYSTTVVRRKADAGGDYNVVLVDLQEGPRMMSRVAGLPPGEVRIGMRVQARIVREDGQSIVVFEPA
jgi:uncharacterized OB-fold protein